VIAAKGEQQIQDAAAADAAKMASTNVPAAQAPEPSAPTSADPSRFTRPSRMTSSDPSRLSNKDVIALLQAGLSDQIIISKMRTSKCAFDTSPNALIQLKKAGASDALMLAVTNAQCGG
ncbi:MAG TPA: hypothetical protein VFP26_06190, partial [Gemmatimonadaceae bacterium]|nr:hypothetical protein [Gemmatimonadaceae bacterium]